MAQAIVYTGMVAAMVLFFWATGGKRWRSGVAHIGAMDMANTFA